MLKSEAVALFGGRDYQLAEGLGVSRSTVSKWPENLPQHVADQVVGAGLRVKGEAKTKAYFQGYWGA